MEPTKTFHGFPPVFDTFSTILILGSFPSVKSREQTFFYMHPQNRFWKVLSVLFEADFTSVDIDKKTDLLHKFQIALYDVVESCIIEGSKDSSIQSIQPANIHSIMKETQITHIYLNGSKAYQLFQRYFPELISISTLLPSTSPANATHSLDQLVGVWKAIKPSKEFFK